MNRSAAIASASGYDGHALEKLLAAAKVVSETAGAPNVFAIDVIAGSVTGCPAAIA
jgi:hypothetical protein